MNQTLCKTVGAVLAGAVALASLLSLTSSTAHAQAEPKQPTSPRAPAQNSELANDEPLSNVTNPVLDVSSPTVTAVVPSPGAWVVGNQGLIGVIVEFSEPVVVPPGAVRVWTVLGQDLSGISTTFEPVNNRLVIVFPIAVRDDIVTLALDSTILDEMGNVLDGEITSPASPALPSGDGEPGGIAVIRIRVLQGDADRSGLVDDADGQLVADNLGRSVGQPSFDPRADLNGDGFVNVLDVGIYGTAIGRSLPATDGLAPVISQITPSPTAGYFAPLDLLTLRFTEPLAADRFLGPTTLEAFGQEGGRFVATDAALSPDGLEVMYFFDPPLPDCDRLRLKVSNSLADISGELLAPPTAAPVLDGLKPPPAPQLDAHATMLASTDIMISGIAPHSVMVEVSGPAGQVQAQVDSDGRFSIQPLLSVNRANQLFFSSISACGVRGPAVASSITVDAQAPNLFIDFPAAGAQIQAGATDVAGRVADTLSGFMGLSLTVNGQPAQVNIGIGTNGTFVLPGLMLGEPGTPTTITAVATDLLGNTTTREIMVARLAIPADSPRMEVVSGNGQQGVVGTLLTEPIVVRMFRGDGEPFAGKVVTFTATRSDGRLKAEPSAEGAGTMMFQTFTDSQGYARAYWTMGGDAGMGNNRVSVTSRDIAGTVEFCASAAAGTPKQINIGSGNNQKGEAGAPLGAPLVAWVSDSCNGGVNVPVTFTVTRGGGSVNGLESVTVDTGATGHASVQFTLGPDGGNQEVVADFSGNLSNPATFNAYALVRDPGKPTSFSGLIFDNASQPIGGAHCWIIVNGQKVGETYSNEQGQFRFDNLPDAGDTDLWVDGLPATTLGGMAISPGSFPGLHFEITTVPNAENSLPMPVLLPMLDPANARQYSTTQDTILTVEGMEGLKMTISAGSMRLPNGQPATDGTIVALNQVHHDDVPMPMPDGVAAPFAWTLQPGGAHFDPPIQIEYPNMSALPPGAIANFLSFDHETSRFEIVSSGHVTADGSTIVSDLGGGLSISGWGGSCPPYSVTGRVKSEECSCNPLSLVNKQIALEHIATLFEFLLGSGPYAADFLRHFLNGDGSPRYFVESGPAIDAPQIIGFQDEASLVRTIIGIKARTAAAANPAFPTVQPFTQPLRTIDFGRESPLDPHITQIGAAIGNSRETAMCWTPPRQSRAEVREINIDVPGNRWFAHVRYFVFDCYEFDSNDASVNAPGGWAKCLQDCDWANPFAVGFEFERLETGRITLETGAYSVATFQGLPTSAATDNLDFPLGLADGSWHLSVGGQVSVPDSKSHYQLSNVAAPDNFGPGGPGSPRDFLSDDFVGVTGVGVIGGQTFYALSDQFQIRQGQSFLISELKISDRPPSFPQSLRITVSQPVVEIGETTQVTVTGRLSDGSEIDVTPHGAFTTYRTSNPAIASVGPDGQVTARAPGFAFLIASNFGATAGRPIQVSVPSYRTNVVGFARLQSGAPAAGAHVTTQPFGGSATTDDSGFFDLPLSLPSQSQTLGIRVSLSAGDQTFVGTVANIPIIREGYTDAGVITLAPTGAGPLFPGPQFPVGSSPQSVAMGDLNGDGVPDLVAANSNSSSVSVLLGIGDGTFSARRDFTVGSTPVFVAIGDLNGDGELDLAVANGSSASVSVLLGVGDGTFLVRQDFTVGAGPMSLAIGDLDGDDDNDIGVANGSSTTVSMLLGAGDGTFPVRRDFSVGAAPRSVAIDDLDEDGDLDVAVANGSSDSVSVLLGAGDATFPVRWDFSVGFAPRSLAIGDLDKDGYLDIGVANGSGVSVLLGAGDGTFPVRRDFSAGAAPRSVAIGDLDGDGDLDLAVANGSSASVSVLLGAGDGTFPARRDFTVGSSPRSVAIDDLDGDGRLDLVVAKEFPNSVVVLLGAGDGTFPAPREFDVGSLPFSVAIGHLDGDLVPDLAVANFNSGSVSVLLGVGDGSFSARRDFAVGAGPRSVAIGDLDGDGAWDLAVAKSGVLGSGNTVSVLLGVGDGTFPVRQDITVGTGPSSIAIGDLDGDGRLDLAVANGSNASVSVLLGVGDGTVPVRQDFTVGSTPVSVAIGDLNGDLIPDLAVANQFGNSVSVLLGAGDGSFGARRDFAVGSRIESVAIGDLDGDGDLDLAVANGFASSSVSVLLGTGDGSFGMRRDFAVGSQPESVAISDLDGDGDLDLAAVNANSYSVSILLGVGDGTFPARQDFTVGTTPGFVAIGDLNGDLIPELVVANESSSSVSVLINQRGAGTLRIAPLNPALAVADKAKFERHGAPTAPAGPEGLQTTAARSTASSASRNATSIRSADIRRTYASDDGEPAADETDATKEAPFVPSSELWRLRIEDLGPMEATPADSEVGRGVIESEAPTEVTADAHEAPRPAAILRTPAGVYLPATMLLPENSPWSIVSASPADDTGSFEAIALYRGDRRAVRLTILTITAPCCDVDNDGVIGQSDLMMILSKWGSTESPEADINLDGFVDLRDIQLTLEAWANSVQPTHPVDEAPVEQVE